MFSCRIVFAWMILVGGFCLGADFAREADLFLKRMPAGLQDRQAEAVSQACKGDCEALSSVRSSRNGMGRLPAGVRAEELPGGHRLYRPAAGRPGKCPLLIYYHGGGWAFGSVNSCARFCSAVCASAKIPVLGAHYRLAPEHPYPVPLEDCLAAVRLAVKHADQWGVDPAKIYLGGDSAGGNLALACALQLSGKLRLGGLILFYPVVKAWNDGSRSWQKYAKGFGLDSRLMEEFNRAYCGRFSFREPLISPACAEASELAKLPPVLQVNADRDILRDQGMEFVSRLKKLKVPVTHEVFPGTVHLFITVKGQEQAFRRAVQLTEKFMLRP